jgi:hypothetical protein
MSKEAAVAASLLLYMDFIANPLFADYIQHGG